MLTENDLSDASLSSRLSFVGWKVKAVGRSSSLVVYIFLKGRQGQSGRCIN